jgi:DNA-binding MarR family transcriptional regulator
MTCFKRQDNEGFRLEDSLGYHIFRVSMALRLGLRRAFQAGGLDVTPDQFGVLFILWEQEGISQRELAETCFKDMASVTRMIDALERKELVHRERDQSDRRSYRLMLTRKGRDLRRLLVPLAMECREHSFSCLSEADRGELMRMLRTLAAHIGVPSCGAGEVEKSGSQDAKQGG